MSLTSLSCLRQEFDRHLYQRERVCQILVSNDLLVLPPYRETEGLIIYCLSVAYKICTVYIPKILSSKRKRRQKVDSHINSSIILVLDIRCFENFGIHMEFTMYILHWCATVTWQVVIMSVH